MLWLKISITCGGVLTFRYRNFCNSIANCSKTLITGGMDWKLESIITIINPVPAVSFVLYHLLDNSKGFLGACC